MILDYLGGPNLITRVLIRWWVEDLESERTEMLERELGGCPLKMEKGTISQGMPAAFRRWKKQGNEFSPEASRRINLLNTFRPNETHFGLLTWRLVR